MGDDPYLPDLTSQAVSRGNSSSAAGGSNYEFHYGLSKGGQLVVVVLSCLGLGLSLGAVAILIIGQQALADKLESAERRWMDRVSLAEREARIARDEIERLQVEIGVSTNH